MKKTIESLEQDIKILEPQLSLGELNLEILKSRLNTIKKQIEESKLFINKLRVINKVAEDLIWSSAHIAPLGFVQYRLDGDTLHVIQGDDVITDMAVHAVIQSIIQIKKDIPVPYTTGV